MRVFVDLDTQKIIALPGVAQEITTLNFKRSGFANLEVQFTRRGQIVELPLDATGIWGIKPTGQYDADYVTAALAWIKSGTGEDTVYSLIFTFITTPLNDLFMVDGDPDNDVKELILMGELQWTTGGTSLKTPTIVVKVANDVIRGGETVPLMPSIAYAVFLPEIDDLVALAAVPTVALQLDYLVEVLVEVGGELTWLTYRLEAGPATDAEPAEVQPDDYDLSTNDKHWRGAVGPSGPAGSKWRVGSGVPDDMVGADDDMYLDTDTGDVYVRTAGAYVLATNITGPAGAAGTTGTPGATWRTGSGVPSDGVGIDGDLYLRTTNGDVYKRTAGTYGIIANIIGPSGSNGTNGTNGNTVRNGAGTPSGGLGVNGDFYINTLNYDIYGPKTSGSWGSPTSLVGPIGSGGGGYAARSTTSQLIGTGYWSFVVPEGLAYQPGDRIRAAYVDDLENWTEGEVVDYVLSGSDWQVTIDRDVISGSGTFADWNINLVGAEATLPISGGSLPVGGTTGQILTKQSGTDGDADWEDPASGGGVGVVDSETTDTLTYVSDGDTNGIFYFIGTNFGAGSWVNPHVAGRIEVVRSGSSEAGTLADYVDGAPDSTHADNVAGNWVAVDLGINRSAVITKYSLQARPAGDRALRNWKLQGSNDAASNSVSDLAAATWTDIDVRSGDTTMAAAASAWGTYTVSGTPLDYRWLRILSTGVNSTGDNYLMFGEMEMYGDFTYGETFYDGQIAAFQDPNTLRPLKDDASAPTDTGTVVGWIKFSVDGVDSWLPYYQ